MARYIDADKVLELFRFTSSSDDIIEYIQESPAANVVEVRHGEWIAPTGKLECFKDRYVICSECNVMLPTVREIAMYWYCPNCGAKMDGEEESEYLIKE